MKTWLAYNWLKLLALVMALGAIYPFPYVYYQLMGWVILGAAFIAAQQSHEHDRPILMWVLIFTAVIFNPVAPLYFSTVVWQGLDTLAALIFLVSIVLLKAKK